MHGSVCVFLFFCGCGSYCIAPALEGKVDKCLGAASAAVLTKWASWSPGPVVAASVVVRGCVDDVEK